MKSKPKVASLPRLNAADISSVYSTQMRPESTATSSGSGAATLQLSADENVAILRFSYNNLSSGKIAEHLHGPADPGSSAGILFDIDTAPRQADGSYIWVIPNNVGTVTKTQIVDAIRSGRMYINIHTVNYPNGEIRGHFGRVNGSQTFTNPPPPPPYGENIITSQDAARFLTQSTFGAPESEIERLKQMGYEAWIHEQFNTQPPKTIVQFLDEVPDNECCYTSQFLWGWWTAALGEPDQLRQRVAFAYSQIFVVSSYHSSLGGSYSVGAYSDTLRREAFGNFRDLLKKVTLNPAMGTYLDSLGNDGRDGRVPNENYAREVLQLFTIGLNELHPDGTMKLDAQGLPVPTYSQEQIRQFAKVFTGYSWNKPHWWDQPAYGRGDGWTDPMKFFDEYHNKETKTLLRGVTLPANQTAEKDLDDALDNIFNHPNIGPFISRQLIQRLVTSNPSRGYVYRVAMVFNNNGQGVRGDMKAVIRAILLDYEARSSTVAMHSDYGKLREPVLRFSGLMRAFNAQTTDPDGRYLITRLVWFSDEGQDPYSAGSVFNFYQPGYRLPGRIATAGLDSPEFQILDDRLSINMSNLVRWPSRYGYPGSENTWISPEYSSYIAIAGNSGALVDRLNNLLMSGQMSPRMRSNIIEAVEAISPNDPMRRVTEVVQQIVTSPQYAIQK